MATELDLCAVVGTTAVAAKRLDRDTTLKRLTDRHSPHGQQNVLEELGRGSFYEHKHYLFSYPVIPGFSERTIDSTGRTEESVANEIKKVAGI